MRLKFAGLIMLGLAASAQAGTLFSFETGLESWSETGNATAVLGLSPTGATEGIQSLALTDGADPSALGQITADLTPSQWSDIVAHGQIALDYTVPSSLFDSWGNYGGQIEVVLETETGGLQSSGTATLNLDVDGHRTLTADFSAMALPADPGSWRRMTIRHDWGMKIVSFDESTGDLAFGPSTLFLDNIRAIPEPSVLVGVGIASLGLVRRKRQK